MEEGKFHFFLNSVPVTFSLRACNSLRIKLLFFFFKQGFTFCLNLKAAFYVGAWVSSPWFLIFLLFVLCRLLHIEICLCTVFTHKEGECILFGSHHYPPGACSILLTSFIESLNNIHFTFFAAADLCD